MRLLCLLILMLFAHAFSHGQGYFRICSTMGENTVTVNGKTFKIDSIGSRIKTIFPKFDILSLGDGSKGEGTKIYCNFKPDSSYSLIGACCGSTDIVPSWKANHDSLRIWEYDYERDFDKIQSLLMDHPFITLKLANNSPQDSIYGWYVDYACFPSFKLLDEKGWRNGPPVKCFYWNNISQFIFFKAKEDYTKDMNPDGVIEDVYPEDFQEMGFIHIRLFDNNHYTITYDIVTKAITLARDID